MAMSFSDMLKDPNIEMCSFKVPFKLNLDKEEIQIKLKATVTYPRDIRMHLNAYLEFLSSDETVKEVLKSDQCYIYADKYLLAMVFRYFMKIGVEPTEYSPYLFFVALYLAHDIAEEGLLYAKNYFCRLAIGKYNLKRLIGFNKTKWQLFKLLDYQANVPTEWCEKLFKMFPDHYAWQRTRELAHSGATRIQLLPMPGGGSMWDWVSKPTCWRCASFKRPDQPQSSELSDAVESTEESSEDVESTHSSSEKTWRDSWGSLLHCDKSSEETEVYEEVSEDAEVDVEEVYELGIEVDEQLYEVIEADEDIEADVDMEADVDIEADVDSEVDVDSEADVDVIYDEDVMLID